LFLGHLSYLQMPKIKVQMWFFVILLSKVHKERQNLQYTFLWVKMVVICRKIKSFSNSLFSLYSSHSPSIRDFSCTLYKPRELRRLLVDTIQSKQRNCCLYHCRSVLNVRIELSWTTKVLNTTQEIKKGKDKFIIVRLFSSLS